MTQKQIPDQVWDDKKKKKNPFSFAQGEKLLKILESILHGQNS